MKTIYKFIRTASGLFSFFSFYVSLIYKLLNLIADMLTTYMRAIAGFSHFCQYVYLSIPSFCVWQSAGSIGISLHYK